MQDIIDHGEWRDEGRTGKRMKSLGLRSMTHDLRDGLPILTSRQVYHRQAMVELEGFIKGITDKKWYQDRGCGFWDYWADPRKVPYGTDEATKKALKDERDLGRIYGFQYRSFGGYTDDLVHVPTKAVHPDSRLNGHNYKLVDKHEHQVVGESHILNGRRVVTVECSSGFKKVVRADQHIVNDPYCRTCCGVGYIGEGDTTTIGKKLYKMWSHMIDRCYNTNCKEYPYYGARGVTVCERWHNRSNFVDDFYRIEGYRRKLDDWDGFVLDKDHYGSQCYSPDTCIWIPKDMNIRYSSSRLFQATSPTGEVHIHISVPTFSKMFDLTPNGVTRCLRGERPHHKQWKFELLDESKHPRLGFTTPVDQLQILVDKIRTKSYDRRWKVSAWNPADFDKMALVPCHTDFVCYMSGCGTYLDLEFNMRSNDLPLGNPNNCIFYAALLTLLAREGGMTPRYLKHNMTDVHLYEDQIETAKEQLKRPLLPHKPTFELLDDKFDDIFNWTHECYKIEGYEHSGKLTYPRPAI